MKGRTFEVYNPETGAVVFDGFPSAAKALKRVALCKIHMPGVPLKVRPTGSTRV